VVSDLPALTELVTDGMTGRVLPPGDVEALAAVLDELVGDEPQRDRLARAGVAWAHRERSLATNAIRFAELYRRLGAA
jgi:glycosyltransferase involved in cell wall biosynthesis